MKLPIGFRFRPTDEELVVHYLTRKAQSLPLPASVIPELDVLQSDPWSIPGESGEKRYYFWKKNKNNSNCKKSATSCGYWKCNNRKGKEKQIIISISGSGVTEECSNKQQQQHNIHHQVVVGTRKLWTFHSYKGKQHHTTTRHASKTRWVLHEFHLSDQYYRSPNCRMQDEGHDNWVVCRLFKRKKVSKCHRTKSSSHSGLNHDESSNYMEDFTMDNCTHQLAAAAAAASPCSSDITTEMEEEAVQLISTTNSTNEDDQDHENTACSSSCNY